MLVNEGEIGFIAFDRSAQAEPALDIASFRTAQMEAGLEARIELPRHHLRTI